MTGYIWNASAKDDFSDFKSEKSSRWLILDSPILTASATGC